MGLPHAGDWLNVVPSIALRLHLRSNEFVLATKYRLGVPVFPKEGKCPACPAVSDVMGDHAMNCSYQGERIARHNYLRDAIFKTAVGAALGPTREEKSLITGRDSRPADVLIPCWTAGQDTALDITVINPLQNATVAGAAVTPGHALTVAYNRKMAGAGEDCQRENIAFVPLAVESLGGWHDRAVKEIRKLGSALARQTGEDEGQTISHQFQRLSIVLMKGNMALFINRYPSLTQPDLVGSH